MNPRIGDVLRNKKDRTRRDTVTGKKEGYVWLSGGNDWVPLADLPMAWEYND